MEMSWHVAILLVLAAAWLYLGTAATVALTSSLSVPPARKFAQGLLTWFVPFLGAWLVLHILAESEPEALPKRLIGSRGLGWYIIAGAYDGPWKGTDSDSVPAHDISGAAHDGVGGSEP